MITRERDTILTPLKTLPHGGMLFGLEYVSNNVHSWCYLTIGNNSVIATQLDTHQGKSITNSWCREFFKALADLAPIKTDSNWRWFEHYHCLDHNSIDEVFLVPGRDNHAGEVKWKPGAFEELSPRHHDKAVLVPRLFQEITGEDLPDFAGTGYEEEMIERVRQTPYIHDPPVRIEVAVGKCRICGQMATIDPDADPYQIHLWIHQNKPCPGYNVGNLLNKNL